MTAPRQGYKRRISPDRSKTLSWLFWGLFITQISVISAEQNVEFASPLSMSLLKPNNFVGDSYWNVSRKEAGRVSGAYGGIKEGKLACANN